jgi:hypothetical protein
MAATACEAAEKMKNKVAYVVTSVITLGVGVALGVLLERHYGVEVLLHEETRLEEGNIPEAYHGKLQLFILAGQSNMSGWSDIAPVDGSPDPRIFVFGSHDFGTTTGFCHWLDSMFKREFFP